MKPRAVGGNRKASDRGSVIPWINASGETIPAHAVIQLRTNAVDGMSQASKPNSGAGLFFVSGPADVASGKWGESKLWTKPFMVLVTETVSVGDDVGPVPDSWEMSIYGTGWRVIHQSVDGVATVMPTYGAKRRVAIITGLAAPSDTLGTPTTCTCAVLDMNWSTGQLEVTSKRLTATNFTESFTADDGTYALAEFDGVWEIYWVDCSPSESLQGLSAVVEEIP